MAHHYQAKFEIQEYLEEHEQTHMFSDLFVVAAQKGYVHWLLYLVSAGVEWDPDTCPAACMYDQPEYLQVALDYGCPINYARCARVTRTARVHSFLNAVYPYLVLQKDGLHVKN